MEFIGVAVTRFFAEDAEALAFLIMVFRAEGVVLRKSGCQRNMVEGGVGGRSTLCFSKIPHFSRSFGWARSLWFRRWTALRMELMMGYGIVEVWRGGEYIELKR